MKDENRDRGSGIVTDGIYVGFSRAQALAPPEPISTDGVALSLPKDRQREAQKQTRIESHGTESSPIQSTANRNRIRH